MAVSKFRYPRETGMKSRRRLLIDSILSIVLMLVLLRTGVAEAYRIPSESMMNTLQIGDFILVNKFVYGSKTPDWFGIPLTQYGVDLPYYRLPKVRDPKQGDIIVFKPPIPDVKFPYVKRCIAVGGQTLEIRDRVVYVDGVAMPLPKTGILPPRHALPAGIAATGNLCRSGQYRQFRPDRRTHRIFVHDGRQSR